MKRLIEIGFFSLFVLCSSLTHAALAVGDTAPDFSTSASLAGEEVVFSLSEALETGPVVLYFYPAAFTRGCTIEAHEFAEATDVFAEYNATVIGVSADDLATLHEFSVSECRDKFAVAADADGSIIKSYDAVHTRRPELADRVSYVISPTGEILHVHVASDPYGHISESLSAVKTHQDTSDD